MQGKFGNVDRAALRERLEVTISAREPCHGTVTRAEASQQSSWGKGSGLRDTSASIDFIVDAAKRSGAVNAQG